jgi:hypothetical protein
MKFLTRLVALCTCVALYGQPARAQTLSARPLADRAAIVTRLLAELRSSNSEGDGRYLAIREDYANRIWSEVDAFVTEAVSPRATVDSVTADLDTLLAHKRGDLLSNAAFLTTLPGGRYLIVALEIQRIAGAFSDNAFSIRAYRDTGSGYTPVAHTEIQQPFPPGNSDVEHMGPTHHMRAVAVRSRPPGAEFWLFFWADATARRPSHVTIRLFAFDARSLRVLWAPPNIESDYIDTIKLTPAGFIVRSVFDPTGGAFGSPTEVLNEQYVLTIDGPQKTNEWNTHLVDERQ